MVTSHERLYDLALLDHARMAHQLAFCKSSIGELALDVAHGLTGQNIWVDSSTAAKKCGNKISLCRQVRQLVHMLLRGHDSRVQCMYETKRVRRRRVQSRILQVNMVSVWAKCTREGLRQHPQHTHAPNQVAVLTNTGVVRGNVVRMQTTSDSTANQSAMHGAHDRVRKYAQLQKPIVQFAQVEDESSWRHIDTANQGVWVAPNREMRPVALQHHRGHSTKGADMLDSSAHVRAQPCTECVEVHWVVQLQDSGSRIRE